MSFSLIYCSCSWHLITVPVIKIFQDCHFKWVARNHNNVWYVFSFRIVNFIELEWVLSTYKSSSISYRPTCSCAVAAKERLWLLTFAMPWRAYLMPCTAQGKWGASVFLLNPACYACPVVHVTLYLRHITCFTPQCLCWVRARTVLPSVTKSYQ